MKSELDTNEKLLTLLANPMLLTVYCQTCGELLQNLPNSHFAIINPVEGKNILISNFIECVLRKNYRIHFRRQTLKETELVKERLILKMILPFFSYSLYKLGRTFITRNELELHLGSAVALIIGRIDEIKSLIATYNHTDALQMVSLIFSRDTEIIKNEIISYLSNTSCFFKIAYTPDNTEYWQFAHQFYRDFFLLFIY